MALPTSDQKPSGTKVDFSQRLPEELLKLIADYVASTSERSHAGKPSIKAFSRTCRNLRATAAPILFETVTITISLTDEIPRKDEPWRPRSWQIPDALASFLRSPNLRSPTRKVRISVQPFPIYEWTDERFATAKRLLQQSRGCDDNASEQFCDWRIQYSNLHAEPTSQKERQQYIMDAFRTMFQLQCMDSNQRHTGPWTEDALPLLQPLLLMMPKLLCLETAKPYREHSLGYRGTVYTDRLILRVAPPKVESVSLRGWPNGLVSVDGYAGFDLGDYDFDTIERTDPRLARFVALVPHLTTVSLHHPPMWLPQRASTIMQLWTGALHQLHSLTTLTLSQSQPAMEIEELTFASQRMPPKLQMMLVDVVLPSVKDLKLSRWSMSTACFRRGASPSCILDSFPAVAYLTLHNVVVRAVQQQGAERMWREILGHAFRESQIAVVVQRPGYLTATGIGFKATVLGEGVESALRQLTRPSVNNEDGDSGRTDSFAEQ